MRLFGASVAKYEEIGGELVSVEFWMTCINRTIGKSIEILGPEKTEILPEKATLI